MLATDQFFVLTGNVYKEHCTEGWNRLKSSGNSFNRFQPAVSSTVVVNIIHFVFFSALNVNQTFF